MTVSVWEKYLLTLNRTPFLGSELVRASISSLNRLNTMDLKRQVSFDELLRWIQVKARSSEIFISSSSSGAIQLEKC
jgi:hypothetical protein